MTLRPLLSLTALACSLVLWCAAPAQAQVARPFGAATGAVLGGIVGGPVGLVVGAAIGYALSPVVAHDIPARRVAVRRRARRAVAAAAPVPPPQAYPQQAMVMGYSAQGQPMYLAPQYPAQAYAPQPQAAVPQPQQIYAQQPQQQIAYAQPNPAGYPQQNTYAPQQPVAATYAAAQRPPVYARVPDPMELPAMGNYAARAYQPPDNSQAGDPLH
jgi:hypothetical protein